MVNVKHANLENALGKQKTDKGHVMQNKSNAPCKECENCKNACKSWSSPTSSNVKYTSLEFEIVKHKFGSLNPLRDDSKLKPMIKKFVYPYDYMDSFDRFNETEVPSKDKFNSVLNDIYLRNNMNTLLMFGILVKLKTLENTMICT